MASYIPHIRVSDFDLLNHWDLDEVNAAISHTVPGYRYSATFLTTLRSNLHLSVCAYDSPPTSQISTPTTSAFSGASLAHPTPSPLSISATAAENSPLNSASPLTTPSELTTFIAPVEPSEDRTAALRLVADSVAEQRHVASKAVILHPAALAGGIAFLGMLTHLCTWPTPLISGLGLIMVGLVGLRWWTRDYSDLAKEIGWSWLNEGVDPNCRKHSNGRTDDPIVLVTKWGERVVGVVVMRVVKRERKGYVRAWTVETGYRGKGVGRGLLEEATRTAWGKGARGMGFEVGHAHSYRVLPDCFNGVFDGNEADARALLAEVVAEQRREKTSR